MFGNKTIRLHDEETERLSEQYLAERNINSEISKSIFVLYKVKDSSTLKCGEIQNRKLLQNKSPKNNPWIISHGVD